MGEKPLDHCCGLATCHWKGPYSDAQRAPHPFREGKTIDGCPRCGEIGLMVACQAPGCTWPGITRAGPDEGFCKGPFYCDYHWGDGMTKEIHEAAQEEG